MEVKQNYEVTFIVAPTVDESEYKKITEKFGKLIKDHSGEILNTELWGSRKLAYPIERHTSGYYSLIEFKAPGTVIAKLEQELIYDERVIRFLTVKLDKFAVAYNNKRRELQNQNK